MLSVAPLWILLACSQAVQVPQVPQVPGLSSGSGIELHLRAALPEGEVAFDRINRSQWDLGSLQAGAPTSTEERHCGDVVAFSTGSGLGPAGPVQISEVGLDMWWTTGSGRARVELRVPARAEAIFSLALNACDQVELGEDRRGQWVRTHQIIPTDLMLTQAELDEIYLLVMANGSLVRVATCPGQISKIVINPEEGWQSPVGDRLCLPPRKAPEIAAGAAHEVDTPQPDIWLDGGAVEGDFEDQVVGLKGVQRLAGGLVMRGGTLVLSPGEQQPAELWVGPDARLDLSGGLVIAGDLAEGFSIMQEAGGAVSISGSTFVHGGRPESMGGAKHGPPKRSRSAALNLRGQGALISENHFIHGIAGVVVDGDDVQIVGNRFVQNATAILVSSGGGVRIEGNHAESGGLFLVLDRHASSTIVKDNLVLAAVDAGIRVAGKGAHKITGNRLLDCERGFDLEPESGGSVLVDNEVRVCQSDVPVAEWLALGHEVRDLRHSYAGAEACGGRSPPPIRERKNMSVPP